MKPTDILINEHHLIRQFLENLTLAVSDLESGSSPPCQFFEKAMECARDFVGEFHHFKEEHVMFVQLAQKKGGALDAQIEALRHQHERSRDLLVEIDNALNGYDRGEITATTTLLENTAAYIALLRHHIHREEYVFYPLVNKELPDSVQESVLRECEKAEERCGKDALERIQALVLEMGAMLRASE